MSTTSPREGPIVRKIYWLLAVAILLSLTACGITGGNSNDTASGDPVASTSSASIPGTTDGDPPEDVDPLPKATLPADPANKNPVVQSVGGQFSVQLVGSCKDKGYKLRASGLPANTAYEVSAVYKDVPGFQYGDKYGYIRANGKTNSSGQPALWSWNCKDGPNEVHDVEGTYEVTLRVPSLGDEAVFDVIVKKAA